MLKRILAVAVTTLVASLSGALLAGCGGDDDDDGGGSAAGGAGTTVAAPPAADTRIEDTAFVSAFERISTFKMDSTPNSTWTLISPTVEATSDSIGEYGTFSIYVMKSVDASLAVLLLDSKGKKLTADSSGIYFARNDSGTYSAAKVFQPNVFVRWQGTEEKKTGDTFDRLSSAVQQAIDAAKAG